jgi:hypothetical protein
MEPRLRGDFGRAGQAVRAHQVTRCEDRLGGRAALTAVCKHP